MVGHNLTEGLSPSPHRTAHNAIHDIVNEFDTAIGTASVGDVLTRTSGGVYAPALPAAASGGAVYLVDSYVQVGDPDDTLAWQRAINAADAAGGGVVQAGRDRLYLVTGQGTRPVLNASGSTTNAQVCLYLPSNVVLDGNHSTLKIGNSTPAAILANETANAATRAVGDTDLGIRDITFDGNNLVSVVGLVVFCHLTKLKVLGTVRVTNCSYMAMNVYDAEACIFENLRGDTITGQPFSFGTPTGSVNQLYDSRISSIWSTDIADHGTGSQPGNGFFGTLTRCSIGEILADTCTAGVKIGGPSIDVAIGRVISNACGDAGGNSGLKLQGDVTNGDVTRVSVGQVVSSNNTEHGLYLELSVDCHIGSYIGKLNNTLGTGPDVWIGGTRDIITALTSDGSGHNGIQVRSYATDAQLGNVQIRNSGQVVAAGTKFGFDNNGGTCTIDNLVVIDDQGTATMTRGVNISSTSGYTDIKKRRIAGPAVLVNISAGGIVRLNDVANRTTQTLAANGAVAINPFLGNPHIITLQANATSSTISPVVLGHELTITWVQDGTGGRTYVWPTTCKFAGGAAPNDTTANAATTVTFTYNGTNWIEAGRAVAVV